METKKTENKTMKGQDITFSFGENWKDYVESSFSEERVKIAENQILSFLNMPDLSGKYILDIGCGSGIHSLAALRAGANRIVSLDLDPASVETTKSLWKREKSPNHWEVLQGSILDKDFIGRLSPADIVYSWGVLHHTGQMWKAVNNAIGLMKPDGVFFVALYTTDNKSEYWLDIKKKYNKSSPWKKKIMELRYAANDILRSDLLHLRNPIHRLRKYKENRGMAYWVNIKDWLGGYPFETAKIEEVVSFSKERDLSLSNIKTGEACTEYLFQKSHAK